MNERGEEFERLSRAFAARKQTRAPEECPAPDQIFEAASGNLARDQRTRLIEHVSQCAECTEAWRLAKELGAAPDRAGATPAWRSAIAASIVLVVGVATYLALPGRVDSPEYRDASGTTALSSQVTGSLPRDRFLLRWSPGSKDSSYSVRLSTADLAVLLVRENLAESELLVPASALTQVKPGDTLLWQVIEHRANGQQQVSETHVVTLE